MFTSFFVSRTNSDILKRGHFFEAMISDVLIDIFRVINLTTFYKKMWSFYVMTLVNENVRLLKYLSFYVCFQFSKIVKII